MMQNFYGGPNGRDFDIRWIFSTRYGPGNSMEADLNMGWNSSISVGSFVMISYGLSADDLYLDFLNQDLAVDKKNYNATLWKKVYDEEVETFNGISYELIAAMTGNTPRLHFEPVDVLDANQPPKVSVDMTEPDKPKITLHLPQSQVLSMHKPITVLDANQNPDVIYEESNINRPTLTFKLPQSQVITQAVVEELLKANENPEVMLDFTVDGTINRPVLKFKLPVAQQLLDKNVSYMVLDADEKPYITFDNTTDPNEPRLVFYLPQSQVMDNPDTTVLDPLENPNVTNIGTVNSPKFRFDLPRAVQFYYGSLLGERTDSPYTISNAAFATYGVGDYYINAATGFIYRVSSKTGTTCTFDYVACIQSPLPEVATEGISPYTDVLQPAIPEVARTFTNSQLTAWKLTFKLPKAPKPAVTATFVGPDDPGSASVSITDKDTITFDFEIPTGSKLFSGLEVDTGKFDTVVDGARPGDLYLNSDTGKVYILNKAMIWEVKQGSLKGPVGDALNIVREYKINETDTITDSLQAGVDYITDHYKEADGVTPIPFAPDEIFAITWISATEENKETSYWYFYTEEGKWGRVQLTGGVMNLIENVYNPETDGPVDNKTYSISYINQLIGGVLDLDKLDKTAFSKDQIFSLLSWGTWEDAKNGDDIPEPDNHDTLSAEEVLALMSWGSISQLAAGGGHITIKP